MKKFGAYAAYFRKAAIGFIAPGAVIIGASVTSASDGGSRITAAEVVTAIVACIVTSSGIAASKANGPKPGPEA